MGSSNPYASPTHTGLESNDQRFPWRSIVYVACWTAAILMVFGFGTIPDSYEWSSNSERPFFYPLIDVVWTAFLMVMQATVFYSILRPESYRRSWLRAFAALVVNAVLLLFYGSFAIGAPASPFYLWYVGWLFLHGVFMLVLFYVSTLKFLAEEPDDDQSA